jgi:hypothetical protein
MLLWVSQTLIRNSLSKSLNSLSKYCPVEGPPGLEPVIIHSANGKIKKVAADPLEKWLSCYPEKHRAEKRRKLDKFLAYVNQQEGWQGTNYRSLLIRHLESEYEEEVLDLLQDYIRAHQSKWRYNSLQNEYSTVRTFFDKNRASLAKDPEFKIRSLIGPTKGLLEVKHVRLMALAARPVYRSMILFKWQSMLDTARLIAMNHPPYSDEIVRKLRARKENEIIQVEVVEGRKKLLNTPEGAFRFCLGKDAIDALVDYFENHRQGGWPKPGESIWLYPEHRIDAQEKEHAYNGAGQPITQSGLNQTWRRLLDRVGLIKAREVRGSYATVRYGFNLHEMRDVATTLLHLKAARHGLDMDCVRFWCGQNGQLDANKYDKFMEDAGYTAEQFSIAEPYLNILSNPNPDAVLEAERRTAKQFEAENKELKARIAKLEAWSTGETVREEVRKILREQGPDLLRELTKRDE